ncbi:protein kinase domain-containing protein [Candidatus Uabimicrobium amorphum]|uniref:Protein kinase n=1 Tax=Uabimicrobium amorphum TaxID=2596890 RepID=A0A5S9IRH6_UABAM|nr:protein kinase [Candidatus Uabimicrobium amorphum]BBM86276.1 protein kinase [Candidatus Uabimicrobium amorphum]
MDDAKFRSLWAKVVEQDNAQEHSIRNTYKEEVTFSHDITQLPQQQTFSENATVSMEDNIEKVTFSAIETAAPKNVSKTQPDLDTKHDYKNYQEINRGGMGIIYRAEQTKLKREIAIKKTLPQVEKSKFLAESLVTAYLDHPNIIPIHEIDQNDEGDILLAMKLVKGISWKDLLYPRTVEHQEKAKEYNAQKHLEVLVSVCNAMKYAHSKGIVHCDLKPENIMIGDFGEVLVMDWGIAVDVRENPDERRTFYKNDITTPMGTPCYMSPELAEGRGKDISFATDVYLLGAILYEILHRKPPHAGESLWQVLLAARNSELHCESTTPAELQQIFRKAMAREISNRYQDADLFCQDLQNYLQHQESIFLTETAVKELLSSQKQQNKEQVYESLMTAIVRFSRALEIWENNSRAFSGMVQARLAYAQIALNNNDFGIVSSQLEKIEQLDRQKHLRKFGYVTKDKLSQLQFLQKKLQFEQKKQKNLLRMHRWLNTAFFIFFALAFLAAQNVKVQILPVILFAGYALVTRGNNAAFFVIGYPVFALLSICNFMMLLFLTQFEVDMWKVLVLIGAIVFYCIWKLRNTNNKNGVRLQTYFDFSGIHRDADDQIDFKNTVEMLIINLADDDTDKRINTRNKLQEIGYPAIEFLLEAAKNHENWLVRLNCLKTIAQIAPGDVALRNSLRELYDLEQDEDVKKQLQSML